MDADFYRDDENTRYQFIDDSDGTIYRIDSVCDRNVRAWKRIKTGHWIRMSDPYFVHKHFPGEFMKLFETDKLPLSFYQAPLSS